jgi:hypothetical protein
MTVKKSRSLRKPVDEHCRCCIYDDRAAGTWRQQVTLCSVTSCSFHEIRPTSKAAIPEHVLDYYLVTGSERAFYSGSRAPEGPVSEHNGARQCHAQGPG